VKVLPISRWAASSWNWLTPAAACLLAMLVIIGGNNHRPAQFETKDHATFFATLMVNADSNFNPNVSSQTFALSKTDVNLEWNVWPHANLKTTNRQTETSHLGLASVATTNR